MTNAATFPRVVCVDGCECDDPDSPLTSDGEFAPFYVFDSDLQDNVAGPFPTRAEAERAGRAYAPEDFIAEA